MAPMETFSSGGFKIAYDDINPQGRAGTFMLVHGFVTNRTENWKRLGWYTAFERKDFTAALRLLQSAVKACPLKKKQAQPCAALQADMLSKIGRIYENDGQLIEAATEYEKALALPTKARAAGHGDATAGIDRLSKKLARVVVPRIDRKGNCREVSEWLDPPGPHKISIGGQEQVLRVRPGQQEKLGSCP